MNARHARVLAAAIVAAIVLAGCTSGPSPEEIMATNTQARAEIQRLVDEATQLLLAATSDLGPEELTDGIHESWSSCTDAPFGENDPPESITWRYRRSFRTPPEADTVERVGEVARVFLDQGWTARQGSHVDGLRIERFQGNDGYALELTGSMSDDGEPSYLVVTVLSPCVPTPPDLQW